MYFRSLWVNNDEIKIDVNYFIVDEESEKKRSYFSENQILIDVQDFPLSRDYGAITFNNKI